MSNDLCQDCDRPLTRLNYFPRQLLTADCMREEQEYFLDRMRRQNRYLHGFGVVCGLDVRPKEEGRRDRDPIDTSVPIDPAPAVSGTEVWVCPGFAVTPEGDEVLINEPVCVDLASGKTDPSPCCDPWPCPPVGVGATVGASRDTFQVWLVVRYAECLTRPVRVPPKGCGCDETDCNYGRVRDSFEIRCLTALPESHVQAAERDAEWRQALNEWRSPNSTAPRLAMPVPRCPDCPPDPWVVLARIVMRRPEGGELTILGIHFDDRRVLLSTRAMQTFMLLDHPS